MLAIASAAKMLDRPSLVVAAVRMGIPVTSIGVFLVEAFTAVSGSGSYCFTANTQEHGTCHGLSR